MYSKKKGWPIVLDLCIVWDELRAGYLSFVITRSNKKSYLNNGKDCEKPVV